MNTNGKLYLIPVTLGDNNPLEVLPIAIKNIIEKIDHYIVENEKTARRFIKSIVPQKSQPSLLLSTINKYTDPSELPNYLKPCLTGIDIGLMSEAGVPGIADPGADVISIAHQQNIQVVPLVGPSSILLAMMASGLNGQNFAFNGYLPIDKQDRKRKIIDLEQRSLKEHQAQVFIETPYRNNKLLQELITQLHPTTRLCVACDITLSSELIKTLTIQQWSKITVDLHKRPCIFIIQR